MTEFIKIKSISEMHRILGVGKPKHPAISLVQAHKINWTPEVFNKKYIWDFYMISLKYHNSDLYYGRNYYDFEEGSLLFMAPGQVSEITTPPTTGLKDGWTLFFHLDLLQRSELGKKIGSYSFFAYAVHEALHLSEDEKNTINRCVEAIEQENQQNIDKHSQTVIVSNLELLLNYCNRFYDRQFYTRSNHQQDVISKIEELLSDYFNSGQTLKDGIPTVRACLKFIN